MALGFLNHQHYVNMTSLTSWAFSAPFLFRLISGRLMPSGLAAPLLILLAWPLLMKARERPGLWKPTWIGHEDDLQVLMQVCKGKVAIKEECNFWVEDSVLGFFWKNFDEALADGVPLSIMCASGKLGCWWGCWRLHEAVVFWGKSPTSGGRRHVEVDFLWQMIGLSTQKAPGTFEHWVESPIFRGQVNVSSIWTFGQMWWWYPCNMAC